MERVSTLLQKLQKQLDDNSTAEAMLQTVHILQAELLNKLEKKGGRHTIMYPWLCR
jgi:hypothetical protein